MSLDSESNRPSDAANTEKRTRRRSLIWGLAGLAGWLLICVISGVSFIAIYDYLDFRPPEPWVVTGLYAALITPSVAGFAAVTFLPLLSVQRFIYRVGLVVALVIIDNERSRLPVRGSDRCVLQRNLVRNLHRSQPALAPPLRLDASKLSR